MKKLALLVLTIGTVLGVAAFAGVVAADEASHWSYEGETGPENWGGLSEDFVLCGEGTEQSPIDIPSTAPVSPGSDITLNYGTSDVSIVNNGHTIQVNYDEGSSIEAGGKTFALKQFHFHAPSEHTAGGAASAMEIHFVHQSAGGELAVIGAMIEPGAENAAYAPVFDNLPASEGEPETIEGASVNAADLLPASRDHYRYDGSLTTPPCSEGVNWFVMSDPVELSAEQIAAFTAIYEGNARPVQSMNDRTFRGAAAAEETEQPAALPKTGGAAIPLASLLAGFGALSASAGLYLRRRRPGALSS